MYIDSCMSEIRINVDVLPEILEKAVISEPLRFAVEEMVRALMNEDLNLAYQLSSVKSLICGAMKEGDEKSHFRENHKHNEHLLGRSVYSLLDTLHFEISMSEGKIPSGMSIMSVDSNGVSHVQSKPMSVENHPTLERMRYERKMIREEAKIPIWERSN